MDFRKHVITQDKEISVVYCYDEVLSKNRIPNSDHWLCIELGKHKVARDRIKA